MRITIDGQKLLEKFSLASRFISNRFVTSSSLQGVLIKGNKEKIEIYSTNLSSYFQTTIKYKGGENFNIVADPKKIIEFLSLLSPGEIYIDIEEKKIVIGKEKTRGTFSLYEVKDFPTPPKTGERGEKIKTEVFKKLPLVIFAASQDVSRPVLTAVNFLVREDETWMVATDGFRLSLLKTKKEKKLPEVLIPAETLTEAIRLIGDNEEMEIGYLEGEKMVVFYFEEDILFSRLIEGEFPPFDKVIPSEKKTTVKLNKEEFLKNTKIVSVFAKERSNIIVLEFKKDGLVLRPKLEGDEKDTAFQEMEIEGDEQKVAFNFKFVLDFLNQIDGKEVIIEVLRPDAPVVFRTEKNKDLLHIIMPVRIQEG